MALNINPSSPDGEASSEFSAAEAPKKKSNRRKYLFSGAFLIVLTALTFYVIFKDSSINDIWTVLKNVKPSYAIAGVLSMLGFILFQGIVIDLSAQCVKIKLTPWEMMQYSFVSFFYSGITPSAVGGQPMQFYHMSRDKISAPKATLILFVTNLTYQIVIVVLGLVMFIAKYSFVAEANNAVIILFFLGLSVNVFILLIIMGALLSENLLRKVLNGCVSFLCKIKIVKRPSRARRSIDVYLEEFKSGVELLKKNKGRFYLILLSTSAHFLLYHIIPFFVYRALGFTGYSMFDFVVISAILYVAINMFPLPGSVGAAESGFVILFGPLFGSTILAAMLLTRFINFYTMLLLSGGISAYAQLRKPYNLSRNHSVEKHKARF